MKKRSDFPLYGRFMSFYLKGRYTEVRANLAHPEMSQAEKKLLAARLLMRESRFAEAAELIAGAAKSPELFLKADAQFLRAQLAALQDQREVAIAERLVADGLFQKLGDKRGRFLCQYNLSVEHNRLGMDALAYYYLCQSEEFAESESEQALILRAQACHHSRALRFDEAEERLSELFKVMKASTPQDRAVSLSVAVDIKVRAGKLNEALDLVLELSSIRKHFDSQRADAYKVFLAALRGARITKAPRNDTREEYLLQWHILHSLQEGETQEARNAWSELRAKHGALYGDFLEVLHASDKLSLFGRLVDAMRVHAPAESAPMPEATNTLDKLMSVLSQAQTPLRKTELIEKIWDCSYDPSYDARFYKLVERLKKQKGVRISSVGRAYRLLKAAA